MIASENKNIVIKEFENVYAQENLGELFNEKSYKNSKLFILALLIVIGSAILASYFIQYPDIVPTTARVLSVNTPKELIPKTSGKIVNIFAKNGDSIHSGYPILYIESLASHNEILELRCLLYQIVQEIKSNGSINVSKLVFTKFDSLGEVQSDYSLYYSEVTDILDYIDSGFYVNSKKQLIDDKKIIVKERHLLKLQKELVKRDLKLAKESFNTNQYLYENKVLSKQEIRLEESKLISKEMSIPSIDASLTSNDRMENQKIKEINEVDHLISTKKEIFYQKSLAFLSSLDKWVDTYVIKAPKTGIVNYLRPIELYNYIAQNQNIGFVISDTANYFAEMYIPQTGFGKTKLGQAVILRFQAYPHEEFGQLYGKIKFISSNASDSGFLSIVAIDNALSTDKHVNIQHVNGLTAEARIITSNRSLFDRVKNIVFKTIER